jgi:alkanesulfonate monooxygenase SsuD/methylene tetrahydromethanopterin reductase-like flavin-dependent oxidoreductase (luciferase family)
MRFTLSLGQQAWAHDKARRAPQQALDTARAADEGGVDALWASEDPEGWDAFAVLSAVAVVTRSAALGTSVTSPYPRHPNMLAASVATLDRLSGGRAVLGLGRGQPEWHGDALGAELGDPLAVMRETIDLLRAWEQPPHRASSPTNGHFAVRDWERVVNPAQGRVPILLAAAGPKATTLAAEVCDGVIFNLLTSDRVLQETIPRVRDMVTRAGRDASALWFVLRTTVTVVDSADAERAALDRGKHHLALVATLPGMHRLYHVAGYDVPALLNDVRAIMGTSETLAAGGGFPALRRAGDLATARAMIPDDLIRELGIIGSLQEVRERIGTLASLGVTHVGVAHPPQPTSSASWRSLLTALRD